MKAACGQSLAQSSGAKTILCVFRKRQAVNIGYARCIMYQTKTRLGIRITMASNIRTLTKSMGLHAPAVAAALSLTKRLMQFQSSQSIQGISELLQGASHCAECWSWKEK